MKISRDLKPVLNGSLCDFTLIEVQFSNFEDHETFKESYS